MSKSGLLWVWRKGHFKRNCLKTRNTGRVGRILAISHAEVVADAMVVTGTVLLNNSYACILFDCGAERSFVNQTFKHLPNQQPQELKETFIVEMANGKTESTNDIYIGCALTLDNYSFQIYLMLVSVKSFDIIIGMDWLSLHHVDILCFEKSVRLHLPNNETLVIYGDKPGVNLRIISCIQAQKYLRKD